MARREMTVERFEEIKRLIEVGQSDRKIALSLKVRRDTVAEIRRGERQRVSPFKDYKGPLWAEGFEWKSVIEELGYKQPLKYIWEEKARDLTSYTNFWKVFYRKFPNLQKSVSTPREFNPGERVEVDWAGGKVEWIEPRSGEVYEATVFIGCLGYSQLIFAQAFENMKSRPFLEGHRRMFEFYGGVPSVMVPDCTKTAVIKCHLYDPDLNPGYVELARHYQTAIVPARPYHPKDKALVELSVKLVMRYFGYLYRNHTFTSIVEINEALLKTCERINNKPHTRFGVSRRDRFEKFEKSSLKTLPVLPFEPCEWKDAILHPDCTLAAAGAYYSAPHIHRGRTLQVKLTENTVEIFWESERVAIHQRDRWHKGRKVLNLEHFPENSKAYYEATPKNLLSQARFLSFELHELIDDLFKKDTLAHIRIAQGFIRTAKKHINETNFKDSQVHIKKAIETMRSYNRYRVAYFKELLTAIRKNILTENRNIQRKPGNPMLRHTNAFLKCPIDDDYDFSRGNGTPENDQPLLPMTQAITEGEPNGNSSI